MYTTDVMSNEYNPYYTPFIEKNPSDRSLIDSLIESKNDTEQFFNNIPEDKLAHRYAEGKWTPKEVLMHIIDTERIFSYRALRFARKDKIDLLGFDQNEFVSYSDAAERSLKSLIEEYIAVRNASIILYKNFTTAMLKEIGIGSGSPMSVRALGFITVGHEMHHIALIKERYL